MADAIGIPPSLPTDSADVAEALEVAAALWQKGDHREGVRWVRHAVKAADEEGDALRMAALARGAAELEEFLAGAGASAPTPTPPPVARGPSAVPPPLPKRSTKPPPSTKGAPSSKAPPSTKHSHSTAPPPSSFRSAAMSRTSRPPPPLPSSDAPTPSNIVHPPSNHAHAPSNHAPTPSVSAPVSSKSAQSGIRPSSRPVPLVSSAPVSSQGGVRVSVKTSVRDPSLLVVRRLGKGQAPPPGTRGALLVMDDGVSAPLLHEATHAEGNDVG